MSEQTQVCHRLTTTQTYVECVSESSNTLRRPVERVVFAPLKCQRVNDNTAFACVLSVVLWCRNESVECSNVNISAHSIDTDLYNVFNFIPTLRQTKPQERPEAAICVRKSSARRVLHFTPLNAASCVLHRPANRVIHRLQL